MVLAKKFITTTSINIDAVPKKQEIKIEPGQSEVPKIAPKIAKIEYQTENKPEIKAEIKTEPLVAYGDDSDSGDDSDPENPSCMAFCNGFKNSGNFPTNHNFIFSLPINIGL